ncbi:MAG: ATP-binding protein [Nanoarchaeota archaeon]|nr:ATP-binding protein [Nanoarchaeota archaeon]
MTIDEFIVHEFVPPVEKLMDIYANGWQFPLTTGQTEEARKYMASLSSEQSLRKICNQAERLIQHQSLAARLYGHDLRGEITYCLWISTVSPQEISSKTVNTFMRKLTVFRLFGLTMGYLSSQEKEKYLTSFPVDQLDYLLASASQQNRKISQSLSDPISNVEFVILYEIVKNAPTQWELSINKQKKEISYTVQDFGQGIRCKKKGESDEALPLPAQEYPRLFKDFSTKEEGGLGLQIVKKLTDSLQGYVEIVSTTELATIHYSTKDEQISSLPCYQTKSKTKGTLFSCYVPQKPWNNDIHQNRLLEKQME